MEFLGRTESAVKPEHISIDEYSVWIAEDIEEVIKVPYEDEENPQEPETIYVYNLIRYDINEYYKIENQRLKEANAFLEECIVDLANVVFA